VIRFIAEHKDHQVAGPDGGAGLRWGVEPMCAVLSEHGVPIGPSTYYEWIAKAPTRRQLRDAELVEIISAARQDKKTGKYRPWDHASCGSGCAATVMMSPAARWSGS
jgi:putative transposase